MSLEPNAGAAALAAADTIEGAASKLGCSARQVSRLRSSQQLPNENTRRTIERVYGIPRRDWDRRAGAPSSPADTPPPAAPQAPTEPLEESAETRLRAQMARLAAMRADPA
jgi:transcriptional regulator with XRE-family HTH domain